MRKNTDHSLTDDQLTHLVQGFSLDNQFHPYYEKNGDLGFPFRDERHRRQLYLKYRDFLHGLAGKGPVDGLFGELRAGKRPAAYYDYEEGGKR